jgi:ParB-like chromosome segregation protein Spo0J
MTTAYDKGINKAWREKLARAPVSNVTWIHRDALKPNDYNPNVVPPPELELLIVSIMEDGFTQPIVVLPDMTIVDGFHRYTVSGDPRLLELFGGHVPTVTIDIDAVHRRMSTIRHNRARGEHGIVPMATIVRAMLEEGVSSADIQRKLGMEQEEVERLADRSGMAARMAARGASFGPSWVPDRNA